MSEPSFGARYVASVAGIIDAIVRAEAHDVAAAARLLAGAVAAGGVVHVFGAGHSQLVAGDATYRAGGPAWANGILDPALSIARGALASSQIERIAEVADTVFSQTRPCDVDATVVVTNSGMTPITVRWARLCRERGLPVIGIASRASIAHFAPPGGSRGIEDITDLLIDNHCPVGDASVGAPIGAAGVTDVGIGPTSTIASAFVLQWLAVETHQVLLDLGEEVLAFRSSHMADAEAHNAGLVTKYRDRIGVL